MACALAVLGMLGALGTPAGAEDIEVLAEEDDEPAFNMLGFRMGVGALPLDHERTLVLSIGVGVEHPVFKKTRVFGEYDWLWLSRADTGADRAMDTLVVRPERHASGHRASVGLRRELVGKGGSSVRVFVDGELGGGLAMANDNLTGVTLIPAAFIGLRFGYDVYSRSDSSPSRMFEAELLLRAIAVREGVGMMFGVGMLWGN